MNQLPKNQLIAIKKRLKALQNEMYIQSWLYEYGFKYNSLQFLN